MRLFKIRLSRVSASLLTLLLMGSISLLPSRLAAQTCTGTLQSSTQTSSYMGTGNDGFSPTFSQYNPPAGYILVSAVISSQITMVETIVLTNKVAAAQNNVHPGAYDNDEIVLNGTVITTGGTSNSFLPFVNVPAGVGSTATDGPGTLFNNTTVSQPDSITTASGLLNNFIGTGSPNVQYVNVAGVVTGNGSNVNADPSISINETVTLTYYYCFTGPLAVNLLNFTATLQNPQSVLLNWLTTGEDPGEKYVVQVSTGSGTDFTNVDTVSADGVAGNGAYAYEYAVPPADKGNLYFRLEIIEPTGVTSYSPLRIINLGNGSITSFSIYPNPPSTFINLSFPGNSQNWDVQIFAANGDLVQQNYFSNTNLATVNFNHKMAAGAYFVRAVGPQTNTHYSGSFIIKD
jgi:Secretion system C-terminal sorting domain